MVDSSPSESKPGMVTVKDAVAAAPVIYFDGAPNYGAVNGIINITLAISRYLAQADGTVTQDVTAAAHLRCNVQAALALRKSIDDALLLAAPAAGGSAAN